MYQRASRATLTRLYLRKFLLLARSSAGRSLRRDGLSSPVGRPGGSLGCLECAGDDPFSSQNNADAFFVKEGTKVWTALRTDVLAALRLA